jgi:hypothetical protein
MITVIEALGAFSILYVNLLFQLEVQHTVWVLIYVQSKVAGTPKYPSKKLLHLSK